MAWETLIADSPPSYQPQRLHSPNVLIVGETGVGKSSVTNLIAGDQLADVSSRASGCTMEAASYDIILRDSQGSGHHIRLFDTVGLNEPSMSENNYLAAIEKANVLITQLWHTGGIRLLIFCIRGCRITSVTQSNYHLFRYILCQNKVPVAFVITGMESEQPMEAWWGRNKQLYEKADLLCDSHVCVTAIRGLNNVYNNQYNQSQIAIRNMLLGHMSGTSWKPDRTTSWFIHLAGVLLAWVAKVMQRKRRRVGRAKDLTVEELARRLEEKCRFSREDAVMLAGKIWIKRTENIDKVESAINMYDIQ